MTARGVKGNRVFEAVFAGWRYERAITVVELKWFQVRQKILNWRTKQRDNQYLSADRARERSIHILQKRYGFSREKAAFELDKYYPKARLG
jgi:hypothetical protein